MAHRPLFLEVVQRCSEQARPAQGPTIRSRQHAVARVPGMPVRLRLHLHVKTEGRSTGRKANHVKICNTVGTALHSVPVCQTWRSCRHSQRFPQYRAYSLSCLQARAVTRRSRSASSFQKLCGLAGPCAAAWKGNADSIDCQGVSMHLCVLEPCRRTSASPSFAVAPDSCCVMAGMLGAVSDCIA